MAWSVMVSIKYVEHAGYGNAALPSSDIAGYRVIDLT